MSHLPKSAMLCAEQVRTLDFHRYASTLFVTPEHRRALLALYAFNSEIAQVRARISQPLPGEIRLQWWIDALSGAGQRGVEGHPVAVELLNTVKVFGLPVDGLLRLINAHRFDLYDDPMPTMDSLELYLSDTASTLFSLAARICASQFRASGAFSSEVGTGSHEENATKQKDKASFRFNGSEKSSGVNASDELIRHAGLAHGLVDIMSLLPVHAVRRQLYLPQQLLEMNVVSAEDIFAGHMAPEIRTVLAYLSRKARKHLDMAFGCLTTSPPELRPAFLSLSLTQKILGHMERMDFNPFQRTQLSRLMALWTLWRASHRSPFKS